MNVPEFSVKTKLHSETALMPWRDLQRFFAKGVVIVVDTSLNLVSVATLFAEDRAKDLLPYTESGDVSAPTNDQARDWYTNDAELWSVVVAPYVLVQEPSVNQANEPQSSA